MSEDEGFKRCIGKQGKRSRHVFRRDGGSVDHDRAISLLRIRESLAMSTARREFSSILTFSSFSYHSICGPFPYFVGSYDVSFSSFLPSRKDMQSPPKRGSKKRREEAKTTRKGKVKLSKLSLSLSAYSLNISLFCLR